VTSEPTHDPAEGYVRRAALLADLGRYDEAGQELGFAISLAPDNAVALSMLAAVHLAAERPEEALAAAEEAIAAAPGSLQPLIQQGMALCDLRRFKEAALVAELILGIGPDDPYAQLHGAAILGESRNGQKALNAAWRAVELAPEDPQAHLVLGVVAARMELFDLAERAYREALRLDPELAEARHNVGVVNLEQRRFATALEHLAEAAAIQPVRSESTRQTMGDAVSRLALYVGGYTIVAAVFTACMHAGSDGASRVWGFLAGVAGLIVIWAFARKLATPLRDTLRTLMRSDRPLGLAIYATLAGPALILLYALIGTPWPLALAIATTAVAEIAVVARTRYR